MRTKSFPYSIPTRSLENAAIVSISNVALVQFVVVLNQFKLLARFFVVFVCLFLFTVIKRRRPPALSSFPDSFPLVSLVKVLRVLVFFKKNKNKMHHSPSVFFKSESIGLDPFSICCSARSFSLALERQNVRAGVGVAKERGRGEGLFKMAASITWPSSETCEPATFFPDS